MNRQVALRHTYVEYIPEKLEPGMLYISHKYRTASHLCACGCGLKVVTPLNPAQWKLIDHGKTVSLFPSIGNWSLPCRSHYWIDHGQIHWSYAMSERQIADVKKMDRLDVELHTARHTNMLSRFMEWLKEWFNGH